jgi:hypothetical protein
MKNGNEVSVIQVGDAADCRTDGSKTDTGFAGGRSQSKNLNYLLTVEN